MFRALALSVLSIGVLYAVPVFAYESPGAPTGHVSDFAGALSREQRSILETNLTAFSASTSNEIAVVIVPTLGGDYIENYAVRLFEEWGIGTAQNDNGVLLLLALEERELRIEVGYGLEGALTDSEANAIITDLMVPLLREGDYDAAVALGVEAMKRAIEGEYGGTGIQEFVDTDMYFGLFIVFIALVEWLAAILARSKSFWAGGAIGIGAGVVASTLFSWWILVGAMVTIGLALFGLMLDYAVSTSYSEAKRLGKTPPWWGGGGFGGRSSGGFGGFGGGMSGGGGASGRW